VAVLAAVVRGLVLVVVVAVLAAVVRGLVLVVVAAVLAAVGQATDAVVRIIRCAQPILLVVADGPPCYSMTLSFKGLPGT
jgi:hypothetical protein